MGAPLAGGEFGGGGVILGARKGGGARDGGGRRQILVKKRVVQRVVPDPRREHAGADLGALRAAGALCGRRIARTKVDKIIPGTACGAAFGRRARGARVGPRQSPGRRLGRAAGKQRNPKNQRREHTQVILHGGPTAARVPAKICTVTPGTRHKSDKGPAERRALGSTTVPSRTTCGNATGTRLGKRAP